MRIGIFAAAGSTGSAVDFTISPAYAGKSSWSLAVDGPLNIGTTGEYTIIPQRDITVATKMWGAGGGRGASYSGLITGTTSQGPGGAGGYSAATIILRNGSSYILRVGQGGDRTTSKVLTNATYLAGGVGAASNWGTQGGGYSGLFKTSVTQGNALLMAGGGGGGSDSSFGAYGGAGGGTSGQNTPAGASQGGLGGTASAGGGASSYNGATAGTALTGGRGQMTQTAMSEGGGGGYFGGGGGNVGGGGGGSGRIGTDADVSGGTTTVGAADVPGNSADGDRNGSGRGGNATSNTGADGRILLTLIP